MRENNEWERRLHNPVEGEEISIFVEEFLIQNRRKYIFSLTVIIFLRLLTLVPFYFFVFEFLSFSFRIIVIMIFSIYYLTEMAGYLMGRLQTFRAN